MSSDDDTIDLRNDESEFRIGGIEEGKREVVGKVEAVENDELEQAATKPHDKVKVKFDKFMNLVASHAYEEVFEKHEDEDVIISTDLLTDLANAHEEKRDTKVPIIFVIGLVLGVVLTWLLFKL